MSKTTKKKILAAAVITVVLLGGGGAAFAFWTAGGAGTGTAATKAGNTALTVVQTSTVSGLEPAGAAQTLAGNFTNTNTNPVYVATVTASIASITKAAGAPAGTCDATDFTLTAPAMTVNAEVPAGTAKGAWTGATIQFNNKPAVNQDACKGATVNFAYAIS